MIIIFLFYLPFLSVLAKTCEGCHTAPSLAGLPDPNKLHWNMSRLATESPPVSPRMMYPPNMSPMAPNLYPYSHIDSSSAQFRQLGGISANSSISPSTPKGPYTATILSSRLHQPHQLQSPGVGYTPYSAGMGIKMLPSFQQLIPKTEAHNS